MSFSARIDAPRWRAHLRAVSDAVVAACGAPLVPVVKGHGYGLGQGLLAAEASALGPTAIAVGTVFELDSVRETTDVDVIVLEPFEPRDAIAADAWWHAAKRWDASRLIRTIAAPGALLALASNPGPVRVLVEGRSSMQRFGFDEAALASVLAEPAVREAVARGSLILEGLSLHLPIASSPERSKVSEARRWRAALEDLARAHAGLPAVLWVSHLDDAELASVAEGSAVAVRARVGTRLWLGDRDAITVSGTVLAVRPLPDGTHVGYRQRTGPKGGTLLVVSGGTAHGIGLSAPSPASSLRQRLGAARDGALDAAGRARSPFVWQGEHCWFAEPPHQQHSMIWIGQGVPVPQVGDAVTAEVRFTTSQFDAVILD